MLINEIYDKMIGIKDYSFRDQIQRASISVMNNISEGFERGSAADFARMLDISKGSSGEVRSMLYLAEDMHYIPIETAALRSKYAALSANISSLIKLLELTSESPEKPYTFNLLPYTASLTAASSHTRLCRRPSGRNQ